MNLQEITRPIEKELETFDDSFRQAMRSKVAFVDLIARYIVRHKGKRIRPALVLLSAKTCGEINESSYRGAALVEILHTATLIHDDVVDDADTRRGFPSLNAVWKNKIAVLMGDYMLAKGMLLSLDNNDFVFLKIISEAIRRIIEAEILQIAKSRQLDIDERTYLKIISDKTASLISTCCQIGAASVTSDPGTIRRMETFGENIGMVFQIRDDLLDYTGRKSITGKPTGLDLKEKKLTLPLIYALTQAPKNQRNAILRIVKNGAAKKELQAVVEFTHEFGGIEYTTKKGEYYSTLALEAISPFPDSPAKESLTNVIDFFLQRSK